MSHPDIGGPAPGYVKVCSGCVVEGEDVLTVGTLFGYDGPCARCGESSVNLVPVRHVKPPGYVGAEILAELEALRDPRPTMTAEEIVFLAANVKKTDRVFEWGSGNSTLWMAERCRYITSVEHKPEWVKEFVVREAIPRNVSLLYCPPDLPFDDTTGDDGDLDTFRTYVEAYQGRGIDVVLIDGRARIACARQVFEGAQYGPHPDMRIFIHDADRSEYERIWLRDDARWGREFFRPIKAVGSLLLMGMRT